MEAARGIERDYDVRWAVDARGSPTCRRGGRSSPDSDDRRPLRHLKGVQSHRGLAAALLSLAGLVLIVSYVGICVRTGSLWPWSELVHEDGQRTLIGTILYGHQAREVFTHSLVTLPAAWGVCLLLSRPAVVTSSERRFRTHAWPITASAAVIGVLLGIYLCLGALMTEATSYGQTKDVAMLIFPHFFEHSFTYVLVPSVAVLTYEVVAQTTRARRPGASQRSRSAP